MEWIQIRSSVIGFTLFALTYISKDHNGNKRNYFLFFVLSLVLVSKP